LSLVLFAAGIVLLSYWVSATIEAKTYQDRLAHRLETLSPAPGMGIEEAHATRREASSSGLVGRLEIPRLGVSAMITEGVTKQSLGRGIGHVPDTSFPGERGNVGLAAHRDTYFRPLKDVVAGDRIRLFTPDGVFSYEVDWIEIVDPDRVDLLANTAGPALTLVTCYPFHWIGNAPKRFVVRCLPVPESDRAQPLPALVTAAPADEEEVAVPIAAQAEIPIDSLVTADPVDLP
jgi:sortase A